MYGHLVVGPTAEDCSEREHASLSDEVASKLVEYGELWVPALAEHEVVMSYAGLRPATGFHDYQLHVNREKYDARCSAI